MYPGACGLPTKIWRPAAVRPDRSAAAPVYDDTKLDVILMSGLPGAGKDHWINENAAHLPVVSLDHLRRHMGVPPEQNQNPVVSRSTLQAAG